MSYRIWNNWQKSLPWGLRWFIFLIILRPIIDNFYYIKPISPLVVAGVLTPILAIQAIRKFSPASSGNNEMSFTIWAALLTGSAFFLLVNRFSMLSAEMFLKITLPIYLYVFLKRLIYSISDLEGILFSLILASYISGIFLIYELIFNPIQEVEYSRGVQRYRGGYADVMNYGIYMSLGYISSAYFFIKKQHIRIFRINNFYVFTAYSFLIAVKISHMASYGVLVTLLILTVLFILKRNIGIGFILILMLTGIGTYYGEKVYQEKINPLIEKDLLVLEGEKDQSALLHGRMGRWEALWHKFKSASIFSRFLGTGAELSNAYLMGSSTHNDYLRIIFTSGWIGFIAYLSFLFGIIRNSFSFNYPERYLAFSAVTTICLFSITTTPSFYANFLYGFMAIAVFFNTSYSHHNESS